MTLTSYSWRLWTNHVLPDPVFFVAPCGTAGAYKPRPATLDVEEEDDPSVSSIGAVVEFAATNNLLGVFADAAYLVSC